MNLYKVFEGMNGENNSKDTFYSPVFLGFHEIIHSLQRPCL